MIALAQCALRRAIGFCAAALAFVLLPATATVRTITLEEGQMKTWSHTRAIVRAATANEDVVGINVAPPRGVVLTAKKPGAAMISVWDESNPSEPSRQFKIVVTPAQSLSGGHGKGTVSVEGSKLKLSGALSSLEGHAQLKAATQTADNKPAAHTIDATTSNFDTQVQIDIKIVEVSRQRLKAAGFNAGRNGATARYGIGGRNALTGFETTPDPMRPGFDRPVINTNGFVPVVDAFNIYRWGANSLVVFSALEANGFAYTLAEPSLTALSGQTATFHAGGELPIPLRSGSGADSAISVTFKQFGIRLSLTPTVLDNDRITVRIAPEVSEIDEGLSVTVGGFSIPGLSVRKTETTVSMADGETFVISGLVSQKTSSAADKFPILGSIPILGAFFRSNRFEREDRELLMIATPRLVRPFAKNVKLPPLPGEEVRQYHPNFLHMWLLESGKFDQSASGFSQ